MAASVATSQFEGRTSNGSRRTETFLVTRLVGDDQTASLVSTVAHAIDSVLDKPTLTSSIATATVAGTIGAGGVGNASVVVTAAGMTNSPKTIAVAVANNDTASQVAGKIRTALAADTDVNGFFVVSGATTQVILTARTGTAAIDATLNVSVDNGTCSGLTAAPTSVRSQAVLTASISGTTVSITNIPLNRLAFTVRLQIRKL